MPCPDLGALRASIDDAPGAAAALHDHVRACAACSGTLAELQRNAELAAPAIALTAPDDLPPAAGRGRPGPVRAAPGPARPPGPPPPAPRPLTDPAPATADPTRSRRGRRAGVPGWGPGTRGVAAALVAAVVLTGLVATPGGRAAAAGFLAQFRSQRFEVLSLDPEPGDPGRGGRRRAGRHRRVHRRRLPGNAFGDPRRWPPTWTEASRMAGFAVPAVDPSVLPRGSGAPRADHGHPGPGAAITFDRDRALDYLRDNGRPDARLPERYDGTRLVVQVPAVVVQQFAGRDGGPALLVGKAGMLGLDTEGGASLAELREVVLDLPGLPEGTVAQLQAIGDWRNTLPLPVPTDEVSWRATQVEGAEAISFADASGRLHALLWQRYGYIWGVAGVVGSDEARDVANSLA